MPEVSTWQRLYSFGAGPEYAASPETVRNVLTSMNAAAGGDVPFKVLVRMADGSVVIVKPKVKR